MVTFLMEFLKEEKIYKGFMKYTCDSYESEERYEDGVSINIKITYNNGDSYEGGWRNNKKHGQGK